MGRPPQRLQLSADKFPMPSQRQLYVGALSQDTARAANAPKRAAATTLAIVANA